MHKDSYAIPCDCRNGHPPTCPKIIDWAKHSVRVMCPCGEDFRYDDRDATKVLCWRCEEDQKAERIRAAAVSLYTSARWICDNLTPEQQTALWVELRDALELKPGTATDLGMGA